MVDVNVRAVLQLIRGVPARHGRPRLRAHVNISSIAGLYNFYGHTAYHATKAAVHRSPADPQRHRRQTDPCHRIAPGRRPRSSTELGRNARSHGRGMQTFYEGYESLTTEEMSRHRLRPRRSPPRTGLIEVMPTFQVRRTNLRQERSMTPAPRLRRPPRSRTRRFEAVCSALQALGVHGSATIHEAQDGAAHSTRASSRFSMHFQDRPSLSSARPATI